MAAPSGAAMRTARGNGEDSETSMRTLWQQQMHDTLHPPGAVRAISAALGAVLLFGLVLCSGVAAAQDALPRPPCGEGTPFPAYPAASAPGAAPAVVQAWQAGQGPRWTPPACTGWAAGPGQGFRTLVALAGRIQPAGSTDQVLGRFGAISMLRGVRYWSTSDGAWRPLASSASALDGPDPGRRRTDFTAAELRSGRDAYFVQHDSRSSSDVVYRMRVLESGADRIMVATENVTPVRLMVVTLFQPGALQVVHVLQRLSPTSWGYYGLLRTTQEGTSSLTGGHEASYVNRAAALYRFIAGVPTDRDPPMAR